MPQSAALTKGSGLHCDCNVRWLKDWLLERGLNDITCATPIKLAGVMVTQLKERDFNCGRFNSKERFSFAFILFSKPLYVAKEDKYIYTCF